MFFKRKKQEDTESCIRDDSKIKHEVTNLCNTFDEYFKKHPEARDEPWSKHKSRIFGMNDALHHDNIDEEV